MSTKHGVYLLLVLSISFNVHCDNFCGKTEFREPKGKIETSHEITGNLQNCSWTVVTPKGSALYITIDYLQLGSYDENYEDKENCLRLSSLDNSSDYMHLCTDAIYFDSLAIATNELRISLEITSESFLSFVYTSYVLNCSYEELKCYNTRFFSRKVEKICTDGTLGCGSVCKYGSVTCGDFCYDIHKQRCNGVLDCPTGEDELGCNPQICPNEIRCPDEKQCLTSGHICDGNIDCKNGFDESNCQNFFCQEDEPNCNVERSREHDLDRTDISFIITILFGVMVLLFTCLMCRCLSRRHNIRSMLENPLDIPLPPFAGPGESPSTAEDVLFHDDDFRPGGEIYENISANMEKIKSKRKEKSNEAEPDIMFVKPPSGQSVLDKYFNGVEPVLREDMAALATLKITRDMCHGLRKTKSEERPMTRLLFIDNKDDDVSDDSDAEEKVAGSSKLNAEAQRAARAKSDTDYIRQKQTGVSLV